MSLKTLVKVGNISNLSDARYCAGMGVDMLGYAVAKEHSAYIAPTLYQEIRGWISGPQSVAELYGLDTADTLTAILEDYQPDYLEVSARELALLPPDIAPRLLVAVAPGDHLDTILAQRDRIAYLLVKEAHLDTLTLPDDVSVLVELQSGHALDTVLAHTRVNGVTLSGSPEVRPGYKDYDDLADVLEQLEED